MEQLIGKQWDVFIESIPIREQINANTELLLRIAFYAGYSNAIQHSIGLEELEMTADEFLFNVTKELSTFTFLLDSRPTSGLN
jgi:hypothetical protein